MPALNDDQHFKNLGRSFLALVGLTWLLIVFGAVVRSHGAGLACPDWPFCFGSLLPRMDFRVLLEWGHRAVAGLLTLLFIATSAIALRRPASRAAVGGGIALAAVLLAIQIVLGGLTVLQLLVEWSVVLHLLMGNLFCLVLFLIALRLLGAAKPTHAASGAHRSIAIAAAIVLFIQIVLGGLVSASYAGLACPEWPACVGGEWFPPFSGLVGLHLSHRLGAYSLVVIYLLLASMSARDPLMRHLTRVALSLVLFQILIGVMNVLLRLPVEITALHSATVTLLVLVTGTIVKSLVSDPAAPPGRPIPGGES